MGVVSNHLLDSVLLSILYMFKPPCRPMFKPSSLGPPQLALKLCFDPCCRTGNFGLMLSGTYSSIGPRSRSIALGQSARVLISRDLFRALEDPTTSPGGVKSWRANLIFMPLLFCCCVFSLTFPNIFVYFCLSFFHIARVRRPRKADSRPGPSASQDIYIYIYICIYIYIYIHYLYITTMKLSLLQ